jgi:hypothetical protein
MHELDDHSFARAPPWAATGTFAPRSRPTLAWRSNAGAAQLLTDDIALSRHVNDADATARIELHAQAHPKPLKFLRFVLRNIQACSLMSIRASAVSQPA